MNKIGLFGASGAVGRSIANACTQANQPFRAIGRNAGELQAAFGSMPSAEIATWDPDDPASIRAACRGLDTIVYLIGVPYDRFDLHPVLITKTLEAAIAERVERFALIGTVYPYGEARTATVAESHPREPQTVKGRMRKQQEDILLKAHADGKIRACILRLPDFYGPGVGEKSLLHSTFEAAVKGGTADLLAPLDAPHEFVHVPDVGPVVLALAAKPEAYGRWWHLGGAGTITERQAADRIAALSGRRFKVRAAGKTTLRVLGLFNPFIRELVEMNYLMSRPVILDDSALQTLLGPLHKTSYDDGLRATYEWYKAQTRR